MRTVHKARVVPDNAPDGLTSKVILVEDLGVPIAAALGRWEALSDPELFAVLNHINVELDRRMTEPGPVDHD